MDPRLETRKEISVPWCWAFVVVVVAGLNPASWSGEPASQDGERLFRETVQPLLVSQCFGCHSAQASKLKAGLKLDSRAGWLAGGESGPAVVPGKSGESPLLQALRHENGLAMPPSKPRLDPKTIATVAAWIDAGAPDPRVGSAPTGPVTAANPFPPEARAHWAFQPVRPAQPPAVRQPGWVRTPIDRFVLSDLDSKDWQPAPEATRAEWLRRVTFDLIGLPPTPEELQAFERDARPDAFERVVDRLLASPRYGERWAQHWLDVVRYAESEGYEYDRPLPDAWRFRDYVVASLNADKPFDRFLTEQLAGDEVAPDDRTCQTASIFHRLGPVRRNAGNPEIALSRNEVLTERTDILGTAFLGLTIGCARCHNHKLEPISQKDYYRLQAYMAATEEHNISLATPGEVALWEQRTRDVKAQIDALKARARKASGPEREAINLQVEAAEDSLPAAPATIPSTRNDASKRTPIHLLRRGVWENKGERVGPRPPTILVSDQLPELAPEVAAPRTQLARWLTDANHPLTARVFVNRVWQHHFGLGLVKTVNDFGTHGEKPSHPALLDWLAHAFVAGGWQVKPLHRLIVLSATYRQSSRSPHASEYRTGDPENRRLWQFPRRRLSAEELRDAMLAVSGRMNAQLGGPSVMVPVEPELVQLLYKPSQWQVSADRRQHDRRSLYLAAKRNLRLPFLDTFDAPTSMASCARRESSTHAPQALELLNGRLSNDLAQAFAERLRNETRGTPELLLDRAFLLALGRPPLPTERNAAQAFLEFQPLEELTLALFNLNGFLYVP